MKRSVLSLLVLFSIAAGACGSSDSSAAAQSSGADGEWVLEALVLDDDMAIPLPDQSLELRIDGDKLSGDAGCNTMSGSASFDDGASLAVKDLFWTAMACAEPARMQFEQQYTQAFLEFTSWTVEADRLTLRGDGSTATYVSRLAPPALALVGTGWTVDTFFDGDTAMNAAGMDEVLVVFSRAGVRVSGRCWTIPGFATIDPDSEGTLTIDFTSSDPDFTCDDRSFFADMVDRLSAINDYRIDEDRLILGTSGRDVMGLRG